MVVDDNSDAAEMLTALLGHMGFRVAAAADGPSALETARVFEPDVALLDLGLPLYGRYELAERLRSLPGIGKGLRLVALTGYGLVGDRQRSRAAGFDEHLVKLLCSGISSGQF